MGQVNSLLGSRAKLLKWCMYVAMRNREVVKLASYSAALDINQSGKSQTSSYKACLVPQY